MTGPRIPGCAHSWHAQCGACPEDQRALYFAAHPTPTDPRYRKATTVGYHMFVRDGGDGGCTQCPLPERNRVHGSSY